MHYSMFHMLIKVILCWRIVVSYYKIAQIGYETKYKLIYLLFKGELKIKHLSTKNVSVYNLVKKSFLGLKLYKNIPFLFASLFCIIIKILWYLKYVLQLPALFQILQCLLYSIVC